MSEHLQEFDFSAEQGPEHVPQLEEVPYNPRQAHEIDFRDEQPPRHIPTLQEQPYDPEPRREATRGWLAAGLLVLVFITVGAGIVFIIVGKMQGTALVESILPQVITLAASALGFYFGGQVAAQHAKRSDSNDAESGNKG